MTFLHPETGFESFLGTVKYCNSFLSSTGMQSNPLATLGKSLSLSEHPSQASSRKQMVHLSFFLI